MSRMLQVVGSFEVQQVLASLGGSALDDVPHVDPKPHCIGAEAAVGPHGRQSESIVTQHHQSFAVLCSAVLCRRGTQR